MNERGIYCLVFRNPGITLGIGSLGDLKFSPGWHIYVGSALGQAGFSRVRRHISLSVEKNKKPRWHVDYLLTSAYFELESVFCGKTAERLECTLSGLFSGESVPGFGCSDCRCGSHLFHRDGNPEDEVLSAFEALNLPVHMKKIK